METVTLVQMPTATASDAVSYDDVLQHPERFYSGADIGWVLVASALVFLMIPSLSLIYSGLGSRSFAMTLFRLPMVTAAFVGLQVRWYLGRGRPYHAQKERD
jgi:hypothetical protein